MKAEIQAYLALLNGSGSDEMGDLKALARVLDELVIAYHKTPDTFDDNEVESPRTDHHHFLQAAARRFPSLGLYPVVDTREKAEQPSMLADCCDDLADIADEFAEVLWRLENTSIEDAQWHFRFSYGHWGWHLHRLRLHLFELLEH